MRRIYLVLSVLFLLSFRAVAAEQFVIVDGKFSGSDKNSLEQYEVFSTIGEALDAAPESGLKPFNIRIRNGVYREKLSVDKPNIWLEGESRELTVISFDATGDTLASDGKRLGTSGSFTIRVTAKNFRAENLSIENSFDFAANAARADDDPEKVANPQGVALMLAEGSDRAVFKRVTLSGHQDTLYADAGRSYFFQSKIMGHVDFIFGAGQVVFEDCDIVSRDRANENPTGYIAAPSTLAEYPYGFLFLHSRLLKETPDLPANSVRLGRPWHPGANLLVNGSAVFKNSYMDDHIDPKGYAPISAGLPSGGRVRFEVGPESRFFEYGSHGPGSAPSPDRPVLGDDAARWFTKAHVLNEWRPATVFLAGDSTMAEKRSEKRPETGWGEELQSWLDHQSVRVSNHAKNGRSTRTFIEEGRWQDILDQLSDNDYVFIQFGHNDQSRQKPDRYTPPDQYRMNLVRFVEEARAKGATPVLLTPVVRRRFDDHGIFYDVHGVYPDIVREVSLDLNVALLDMHKSSERLLREYGEERSKSLFLHLAPGENTNYPQGIRDDTHFSPRGAKEMASLVAGELDRSGIGLLVSEPTRLQAVQPHRLRN